MKKILSFLLAIALTLGLATTGFAVTYFADDGSSPLTGLAEHAQFTGRVPAGVNGYTMARGRQGVPVGASNYLTRYGETILEDEAFTYEKSINDMGRAVYPTGLYLFSEQKPNSAEAEVDGKKLRVKLSGTVGFEDEPYKTEVIVWIDGDYTVGDVGKTLSGTLSFFMEDGSTVEFPLQLTISSNPRAWVSCHDRNGNKVSSLRLGETYTARTTLRDLAGELQRRGTEKVALAWRICNENGEVTIQRGAQSCTPTGEWEMEDEPVYAVGGTEYIFELPLKAETVGTFEISVVPIYDDGSPTSPDSLADGFMTYWDVEANSGFVIERTEIEKAIDDAGNENIVIDVPKNMGLDDDSFKTIWEKANGQQVTLNGNGAMFTFDTSKPLSEEFLRDLSDRNGNFFAPSVYSNIQDGGCRMEFMYSGVLPSGGMSVTLDIPKNTSLKGHELWLWYLDGVTGRATLESTTVSFDGTTATFSITHCSAYALYPAGFDPNPKSDSGSSDDDDSSSDSSEADFSWASARGRVKSAKAGSTVRLSLPAGEKIPASLLRALAAKEDVTLELRQGGKTLRIKSGSVGSLDKAQYRFSELQELFEDRQEAGKEETNSEKDNPGTGAPEETGLSLLALALGSVCLVKRLRG